jgi:lipoprotein-anchoring transpeptidase ErfK/SrfK
MNAARKNVSRRSVLLAAGGTILRLVLPTASTPAQDAITSDEMAFIQPRPVRLDLWGRITEYGTPVRQTPGLGTHVVEYLEQNRVIPLLEEVHAAGSNPNNDLWYRISTGYVYTTTVQRLRPYRMPESIEISDSFGVWAEVVVPFTIARVQPSGEAAQTSDSSPVVLYYSSVYRVIGVEPDRAGFLWLKLEDDRPKAVPYYALGRHLRPIVPQEIAPLSSGTEKLIEVDLGKQRIDAYESGQLVFSTLTSSGGEGFETPRGEWWVVLKQASRHMYSDPDQEAFSDPNYFDLPGVPFNIFFTTMGHAIHGTYWHGDFGRPRSHGCLNVTPEAARWFYRWTEPQAPYDSGFVPGNQSTGTKIIVT